MKVGIVGSRSLWIDNLYDFLPQGTTEIISGGAIGIDACAAQTAQAYSIELTEYKPEYEKYGRIAPILRNRTIVEESDELIAFWNGTSKGTKNVIDECKRQNKKIRVHIFEESEKGSL